VYTNIKRATDKILKPDFFLGLPDITVHCLCHSKDTRFIPKFTTRDNKFTACISFIYQILTQVNIETYRTYRPRLGTKSIKPLKEFNLNHVYITR
jgi:hypothetical protein